MVCHMKTTLNIADSVMQRLREEAGAARHHDVRSGGGWPPASTCRAFAVRCAAGQAAAAARLERRRGTGRPLRPGRPSTGRWKKNDVLLFDTNILVYAANKDSELHLSCRQRLGEALRGPFPAFLTWSICYEFLRVTTHPRVLQSPWGSRDALRYVSDLLVSPGFAGAGGNAASCRRSGAEPCRSCVNCAAT